MPNCCCPPKPVTRSDASAGLLCGILNIIFPGIPAAVYGCITGSYSATCSGISQFLLSFLLVGWIWAIIYGALMIVAYTEFIDNQEVLPKVDTAQPRPQQAGGMGQQQQMTSPTVPSTGVTPQDMAQEKV